MKKLVKKLEDIMVAFTFAKTGEYSDEARRLSGSDLLREQEGISKSLQEFKKTALEGCGRLSSVQERTFFTE